MKLIKLTSRQIVENGDCETQEDADAFNVHIRKATMQEQAARAAGPGLHAGSTRTIVEEENTYYVDSINGQPFMVSCYEVLVDEDDNSVFSRASFWMLETTEQLKYDQT